MRTSKYQCVCVSTKNDRRRFLFLYPHFIGLLSAPNMSDFQPLNSGFRNFMVDLDVLRTSLFFTNSVPVGPISLFDSPGCPPARLMKVRSGSSASFLSSYMYSCWLSWVSGEESALLFHLPTKALNIGPR